MPKSMRSIYDTISLYEFVSLVVLLLISFLKYNSYSMSLVFLLILKQIPEKLLKKVVFKGNVVNERPYDAFDCNMINKGGFASENPGFPSGHTTVAWILATIMLSEYLKQKATGVPMILVITFMFAVLVPLARVGSKCHTSTQVGGGMMLGIILGIIYAFGFDELLQMNNRYKEDKAKFYNYLF